MADPAAESPPQFLREEHIWPEPGQAAGAFEAAVDPDKVALELADQKARKALAETTCSSVSAVVVMSGVTFRLWWTKPRKWWQLS